MITCERCKAANLEGGRYCDECGAPLQADAAPPPDIDPAARDLVKPRDGQNGSHSRADIAAPQGAAKRSGSLNVSASPGGGKPHAKLVIERGKSVGKEFVLNSAEANIGRWDADGGIFPDVDLDSVDPEAKVSRRHARITFSEGKYLLEDLGSTNGTFINRGKRLAPGTRQQINDGDEIIVGKTFLRFRLIT